MKVRWEVLICGLIFALVTGGSGGCTRTKDAENKGPLVQKAGSSTTLSGCVMGLMNSLSLTVRGLHLRSRCTKVPDSGGFRWAYIYKEDLRSNEGSESSTLEECIDKLATHLNGHIVNMEISLSERCLRPMKALVGGDRRVWAYDYRGD